MAHTLKKKHMIFDTEIIGKEDPVFLTCVRCAETCEQWSFWQHVTDDIHRFLDLFEDPQYTWVGFNSWKFDLPLIAAWLEWKYCHCSRPGLRVWLRVIRIMSKSN